MTDTTVVSVSNFPGTQPVSGSVTVSNFPATQNVAVTSALPAGSNSIGTVVLGAGAAAIGTVSVTNFPATQNVAVTSALPAGSNSIGTVVLGAGAAAVGSVTLGAAIPTGANTIGSVVISGTPAVTISGNVSLGTGGNTVGYVNVAYNTGATNGALTSHIVAAASTNATTIKASAGRVIGWSLANTSNVSYRYVKLYNITTTPVPGTSTVTQTIAIAPNTVSNFALEGGINHTVGIGYAIVTGSADSDNTAVSAGDVVGDIYYV